MSNILITYFSASGVTAKIAKNMAELIEADTFEIIPKQKYTTDDLNWHDKKAGQV